MSLVNRSGNRASHEGEATQCDRAIHLCRSAGFRQIVLRGDTDFSQTEPLDRWDEDDVVFRVGYDAMPNLIEKADDLPETTWKHLKRPPSYEVRTQRRRRPDKVKDDVVRKREFDVLRLQS